MKFFFISTFLLTLVSTPISAPEPPQNGAQETVASTKQSEVGKVEGDKPKVVETGGDLKEGKKPGDEVKTTQQAGKPVGAEQTSLNTDSKAGDAKTASIVDKPEGIKDQLPGANGVGKPENPQDLHKPGKDDSILHQENTDVDKDRESKRPDGLAKKEDRNRPVVPKSGGLQQTDGFVVEEWGSKQSDKPQGIGKDKVQGSVPADKSIIADQGAQGDKLQQTNGFVVEELGPKRSDGKPQGTEKDKLQGSVPADKSRQVLSPDDSSSSSDNGPQQVGKPQEWKQGDLPAEKSKITEQGDKAPPKTEKVQPVDKFPGKDKDSYTSDVSSSGNQEMPNKDKKKPQPYNAPQMNDYDDQKHDKEDHQKLVQDFNKLSEDIKNLDKKLDRYDRLELHGLYKQATDGECTVAKPSRIHLRERAKWHAWKAKEGMSKDVAMQAYVTKARLLTNKFG